MIRNRLYNLTDRYAPTLYDFLRSINLEAKRSDFVKTAHGFFLSKAAPVAMLHPHWENFEARVFSACVSESDACIDVGANVGFYSCLSASLAKRTVAIEPSQSNLRTLYANLERNGYGEVEVFPVAAGARCQIANMFGRDDMSSLISGWGGKGNRGRKLEKVPVVPLDHLVADRFAGEKLTIKIDVEGFEHDVILGSERVLQMFPAPIWIVEIVFRSYAIPGGINQSFQLLFEKFWSHGYKAFRIEEKLIPIGSADVINILASDKDSSSNNYLFCHTVPKQIDAIS